MRGPAAESARGTGFATCQCYCRGGRNRTSTQACPMTTAGLSGVSCPITVTPRDGVRPSLAKVLGLGGMQPQNAQQKGAHAKAGPAAPLSESCWPSSIFHGARTVPKLEMLPFPAGLLPLPSTPMGRAGKTRGRVPAVSLLTSARTFPQREGRYHELLPERPESREPRRVAMALGTSSPWPWPVHLRLHQLLS